MHFPLTDSLAAMFTNIQVDMLSWAVLFIGLELVWLGYRHVRDMVEFSTEDDQPRHDSLALSRTEAAASVAALVESGGLDDIVDSDYERLQMRERAAGLVDEAYAEQERIVGEQVDALFEDQDPDVLHGDRA